MTKALQEYPSKSSPGKVYTIFLANDGQTHYCDCWQWKRNKTCKHLEDYLSGEIVKGITPVKPRVVQNEKVESTIDNIINNFYPK